MPTAAACALIELRQAGAFPQPYDSGIDYLDVADHLWFLLAPLMRGHAALYQATAGRIGGRLPGLPSLLLLDHVGARSGKLRTTPLVFMAEADNFLVVASKGGHPRHPAWLHNIRAHPQTEVQIGRTRVKVGGCRGAAPAVAQSGCV